MAAATHAPRPLVLVVDDALPVRLVMARTLTDAGYDVLTAPDGLSATTLIQGLRNPPDVVVTDVKMPAMGGEALAAWLVQHYPTLPMIFVSGFAGDHEELPGPMLPKPFTCEALSALVGRTLAGRSRTADSDVPAA
jgi:two-component system cell cycle sensor histidine kinase/response regulator CckA